ncbi:hypothetical protein ACRDNQ_16650 [Palleronia sp. KMU-117]|uniref:hypothetical protein n=1 Tax=Palleronia sp. KMU-117 TaxID=3434108 RepID=UPI003D70D586
MADGAGTVGDIAATGLTKADLEDLLSRAIQPGEIGPVSVFDTTDLSQFLLPLDKTLDRPLALEEHLLLVQEDGSVIVLLGAGAHSLVIRSGELVLSSQELSAVAKPEDDWSLLSDADRIDLAPFLAETRTTPSSSVDAADVVVNVPLVGLAISPLLPPTEFFFPDFPDDPVAGGPPPDVGIVQIAPVLDFEADAPVTLRLADFFEVTAGNAAFGERITEIGVTIGNLPAGTTASAGTITGTTFTFLGPPEAFAALTLTFPTDFSSQSRIDSAPGPLPGEIFANSNFGEGPVQTFPIRIVEEADLEMTGPGGVVEVETDAPVDFRPADAVLPAATDIDGSEEVTWVALSLAGLPPGALVSYDGGASFSPMGPGLSFSGSLAEYAAIVLRLPQDFSTTNPSTTISGEVVARTNEGGIETRPLDVVIVATPDITLTVPPLVTADEDGDGSDGGGVTVDLGIDVFVSDIDGSEDGTLVTLRFSGLPPGTLANGGALTGQSWTGTMAEANALALTFPGDYSGRVQVEVEASNPEGAEGTVQTIEIFPTGDVDLDVRPIVEAETDATVAIRPSDFWQASVSDGDPGQPPEVLTGVTLTLDDLPRGMAFVGVPPSTITYDAGAGGSFSFAGTEAEYLALQLVFPVDFSTKSTPGGDAATLSGTFAATSNEGTNGPVAVALTITPEGDAEIDDTLPDIVPDETDSPITFVPADLLLPAATDVDGSEAIETLTLVVEGLPNDGVFSLADVTGIPAGATATLAAAPDGSNTLTVTIAAAVVGIGNVEAAYAGLSITLPADFSTANRTDVGAATSRALDLTLSIATDEAQGAGDGEATATRQVDIGFSPDIALDAPATLTVAEDDGQPGAPGVSVALGIEITVDDADGSETEDPTDPRFAAVVTIGFAGLPAGTSVNGGTLSGSVWTGTVSEAEALVLTLPGDFSGSITNAITVRTPEGAETTIQTIEVTPTPDIEISGTIQTDETDAPVTVLLADFVTIAITDPNETLTRIEFTLPGLPAGTTSNAGSFAPDAAGTVTYSYVFVAGAGDPDFSTVTLTFPQDFSTTSPDLPLEATVAVSSDAGGPVVQTVPVIVGFEGDVVFPDGQLDLAETDAPVTFRPSDAVTPGTIDIDGSETIELVTVTFNNLPASTRFSTDDGASFQPATPTLDFSGTLEQYNRLVIELPADFSTENPLVALTATITATSNEPAGPEGTGSATLTVTVSAEGDIEITGTGLVELDENDPPGSTDDDTTTGAPVTFRLADALQAVATDLDGSEAVARADVLINGLPDGTTYALGGAFIAVPSGPAFALNTLTPAQYAALTFRLPDDFSTEGPGGTISGSVTFRTDESILAGEIDAGPTDGVESRGFVVTVTSEADVEITAADFTVIEDLGVPIPLNIDAVVTDIDGSEFITGISVTFSGLPTNGPTILGDGTVLSGPTATWTGDLAGLRALSVVSFPEHFSGIVAVAVTVVTNEGDPSGTTDTFLLNVTPVAEPTITLSVDASEANVTEFAPDGFSVKEDTSFRLLIDAATPDTDGSESLTRVVIENVPAGWLPAGAVPLGLFESGGADVASASVSGTTLTITFNPGVTDFSGALRVSPSSNTDRDVETIVGNDLLATVTAVDTAAGLADDIATDADSTDVDIDAVVDPIVLTTANASANENVAGFVGRPLSITNIDLTDTDGSERFERVTITLTIATDSDPFDPTDTALLELRVPNAALRPFVSIVQTGSTSDSVSYVLTPAGGATDAQFAQALENLQIRAGQHFSGIITTDGTVFWTETTTGDGEIDLSDNPDSRSFSTTVTFRPVAEAELTARVFVTNPSFVASGPTQITASADDASVVASGRLILRESTADESGPGQVTVFVGLAASTPDLDGSEGLQTLVIENVPTAWIAAQLSGTDLNRAALFSADGSAPISDAEYGKIASAVYDAGTGALTLTFVPDVTSFSAALALRPSLYEDFDVDRAPGDPFTSAGTFFAGDLNVVLTSVDSNSATTATSQASAEFNVDVNPINNFATVPNLPTGNEAQIDAANGVFQIPFEPLIPDADGSETVISVVLRDLPSTITVWVNDPDNPGGPKVPALITNIGGGANSWSLERGEWLTAELRGIPTHFAGEFPLTLEVVTREANGGTRTTLLNSELRVDPVVDAGDPSETRTTDEDTAVRVQIDGNLIDNPSNSPGSPEAILGNIVISNVQPDSFGRLPLFFDGAPIVDASDPSGYANLLPAITRPGGGVELVLSRVEADNLWVLPGQDSNEDIVFDVTMVYYETIVDWPGSPGVPTLQDLVDFFPAETWTQRTGTIRIDVTGVADAADVDGQDPAGFPGDPGDIAPVFRPDEIVDGIPNAERIYGYAGFDSAPFALDKRLRDFVIDTGFIFEDPAETFIGDVTPLSGTPTEILVPDGDPAADFDGSETEYFLITGVPPGLSFAGATPIDIAGQSFIVSIEQFDTLRVVPSQVTQPTYYDLTLNAIILEDDQPLPNLSGLTPEQALAALDALKGGAVSSIDFTIVVIPDPDFGSGPGCTPEQNLPLPVLQLIGSGDEDTQIALKVQITPDPPFYDSLADLATLPNGVVGSFGLGVRLPPGASLTADPAGAVLFDPITGLFAIDFAALGVDPSDPTLSAGTLLFTPPPHESSPVNPFDPSETFGNTDPYDALDQLEFVMILNNFTCDTTLSMTGGFGITINPVVDGPQIVFFGSNSAPEDTVFSPGITVRGIDPGERPVGEVLIRVDATNGGELLNASGTPLVGTPVAGGFVEYSVARADLPSLQLRAGEHYSGPLRIEVEAATQDIDLSIGTNTATRTFTIIPVADEPVFTFDDSLIDPDTGLPFVDLSVDPPVIQGIEDVPFLVSSVLEATTPDQDGSETYSVVISGVPDYLTVTAAPGAPAGGIINNGDGSYTISPAAYRFVQLLLADEHARTPDALDPAIPDSIPLRVTVNTLELANSDQNSGFVDILFRVRPDADAPTLSANAEPQTGAEDSGVPTVLAIVATTPDPHENMEFRITLPDGGSLFVFGVEQTPDASGVYTIGSRPPISTDLPGAPISFTPIGTVTVLPPPDFSGDLRIGVEAVTIDADLDSPFVDRAPSAPVDLVVAIDPAPDLVITQTEEDLVLDEGDPPDQPGFRPADTITITVTDMDGSEVVDGVFFSLGDVPAGTTYTLGGAPIAAAGPDLVLALSLAEFELLEVQFPFNFASNGTTLPGSLRATTNEGGDASVAFAVEVVGDLDLEVTVTPTDQAQTGMPIEVPLGIDAQLAPPQPTQSETIDEIVVTFDAPLPAGSTVSAGVLSADRQTLTLTRAATPPADFTLLIAALAVTVPGDFDGPLSGVVVGTTNHGTTGPEPFSVIVNDQPVVTGPVDLGQTAQTTLSVPVQEFLVNASDPDGLSGIANLVSDVPDVAASVVGGNVEITILNGYSGPVTFTYDVTDAGSPTAATATTASLDVASLFQLAESGNTTIGPGGATIPVADDVTGGAGTNDIAVGTDGAEAVIYEPGVRDYAGIEAFSMLGGDDLVDLSAASTGFRIDMGAGDDRAIGGAGADTLDGGAGADTLTGGAGADVFALTTGLDIADVITDYEAGIDRFDLSTVLTGSDGIDGRASFDSSTGELTVLGNVAAQVTAAGGGIPASVEVIFQDASGAQATAVI